MTWLKDCDMQSFSFPTSSKVACMCLKWVGEIFDSEKIRLLGISESKCATITKLHRAQIPVWTNRIGDEACINSTDYSKNNKLYSADAQLISQPEHSCSSP
jgi:hypothetical protein